MAIRTIQKKKKISLPPTNLFPRLDKGRKGEEEEKSIEGREEEEAREEGGAGWGWVVMGGREREIPTVFRRSCATKSAMRPTGEGEGEGERGEKGQVRR